MKIKLFTSIAIFYIITAGILIPAFTDISRYLSIDSGQNIVISGNNSDKVMVYKPSVNVNLIIEYIAGYPSMISDYLFHISRRQLAELIISLLLLASGAYIVSSSFNKQYRSLCRKIEDLKSGDFSVKLMMKGYFPEMEAGLKELSAVLEKDRKTGEEAAGIRSTKVTDAVDRLQKLLAGIEGNVNVLVDAGLFTKGSQEGILLESISDSVKEMENIVQPLKQV